MHCGSRSKSRGPFASREAEATPCRIMHITSRDVGWCGGSRRCITGAAAKGGGMTPYIRPDSVSLDAASLLACDNSARGTIQSAFGQAVYPCCSFRSSRRALSLIVMEVSPTTIVDGDGGRRCSRQTKLTLSSGSSVSRRTKRLLCKPSERFPVFIQKVRPSTDSDTWNLNNKPVQIILRTAVEWPVVEPKEVR